ncbi:MAG: family 20 glycosylhydrolase [Balneolaceae bacterium]
MVKHHSVFLLIVIFFITGCTQAEDNPRLFEINWRVDTNFLENLYLSTIEIRNESNTALSNSGWALYFNNLRPINSESLPDELLLTHINGDFYKLSPTASFGPLETGNAFQFSFTTAGSAIKQSDSPSGFYFLFENGEIINVPDVSVRPFEKDEQFMRGELDQLSFPDAANLYNKYSSIVAMPSGEVTKITPTPAHIVAKAGSFLVSEDLKISYSSGLKHEAAALAEIITLYVGWIPELTDEGMDSSSPVIYLRKGEVTLFGELAGPESYNLSVSDNTIEITGTDNAGVFYGIQSLHALISAQSVISEIDEIEIDALQITDTPRFRYRGFHLDVARNFQPAETVKKLLDVMALYKLNKFHFHLTDDEGWRLEIPDLPELTEIGGRRGHTTNELEHLIPSYGSGPDPGKSKGSGWYVRNQFIDILRFVSSRHIEVIPEIDLPGHARAAIVAMKARSLKSGDEKFRLDDPSDESEYRSIQGWDDNVVNVCLESTYTFIEKVFDEIIEMYREADAPLNTIHVGGDEVPGGVWERSPACNDLIETDKKVDGTEDLQNYFFERVLRILSDRSLSMAGWEEVALNHPKGGKEMTINRTFESRVIPYVWSNVWGSGTEDYAYHLANSGFQVVMSHASNFYFDMAYDNHPQETGFYWAAFIESEAPFYFMPFDLFKNAEKNHFGHPIPEDFYDGLVQLSETGRSNILGLQGQLWGETLIDTERVEYMALPRLLSLAERAWSPNPGWADIGEKELRITVMHQAWNEFANRLGLFELPKLDQFNGGYYYRIPPPGAMTEDGLLHVNSSFPGFRITYRTDGSEPDAESESYVRPVTVNDNSQVRIRLFNSVGRGSRMTEVND